MLTHLSTIPFTLVHSTLSTLPSIPIGFIPALIPRFTEPLNIAVELSDISVAARVLAHFPEKLKPDQKVPDNLAEVRFSPRSQTSRCQGKKAQAREDSDFGPQTDN